MARHQTVVGGGGARLHLIETGTPKGRPIVFVHGFSQSSLAWTRQLNSDLADTFRLIAVDMRGHGLSDKPRDAYGDSRLWADDLHAILQILELDQPILCGWSYGPLAILDYIRYYGDDAIAGVNFVGGVTRLGGSEAVAVLGPEFLALVPGFFSADAEQSVRALDGLVRLCFVQELSPAERYFMLGYNTLVPPHVRQALFSRTLDNDDVLSKLHKPALITHGTSDKVVTTAVIDRQMRRMPRTEMHLMQDRGHACFYEDAPAYNERLRAFARAI